MTSEAAKLTTSIARRPRPGFRWLRIARRKPLGAMAATILALFFFVAIFATLIAPYDYARPNVGPVLEGPTWSHPMGTDELGRDMLSRIIYGARLAALVGGGSVLISMSIATTIGVVSGYFGGKVDFASQRLVDFWMAFPPLVLLVSLASIVGTSTTQIVLIIGIFFAGGPSRIVRSVVLSVREMPYVQAAESMGASSPRLIFRHVLPNITSSIIVLASIQLGYAILTEATLSFLGYGVSPPFPTWGRMLSASGITYAYVSPWVAIWPGLAILSIVWAANVFGDALRDLVDPRLRRIA